MSAGVVLDRVFRFLEDPDLCVVSQVRKQFLLTLICTKSFRGPKKQKKKPHLLLSGIEFLARRPAHVVGCSQEEKQISPEERGQLGEGRGRTG